MRSRSAARARKGAFTLLSKSGPLDSARPTGAPATMSRVSGSTTPVPRACLADERVKMVVPNPHRYGGFHELFVIQALWPHRVGDKLTGPPAIRCRRPRLATQPLNYPQPLRIAVRHCGQALRFVQPWKFGLLSSSSEIEKLTSGPYAIPLTSTPIGNTDVAANPYCRINRRRSPSRCPVRYIQNARSWNTCSTASFFVRTGGSGASPAICVARRLLSVARYGGLAPANPLVLSWFSAMMSCASIPVASGIGDDCVGYSNC